MARRARRAALLTRQQLSTHNVPVIPEPPVWQFPVGMTVRAIADTGVRIIDGFCSPAEAEALIEIGRDTVRRSTVIGPDGQSIFHDYRTSSDSLIRLADADPLIVSIAQRAAALLGLPVTHSETFSLTRYGQNEYYKSHLDHDGSIKADRLYTVLLYLNDLADGDGGGTLFHKLNLVTQPVRGRAVIWVNSDTDRKAIPETLHSSLPVVNDNAEKWVAQMWFRAYTVSGDVSPIPRANQPAGKPLSAGNELPRGVSVHEANDNK